MVLLVRDHSVVRHIAVAQALPQMTGMRSSCVCQQDSSALADLFRAPQGELQTLHEWEAAPNGLVIKSMIPSWEGRTGAESGPLRPLS